MSIVGPDDAALVAGCLARKKDSWDTFVGRFSKLVFWSIRKTLSSTAYSGRQDVCEDAYQDVFRKLLEPDGLARLRDPKGLHTFLTVTACHATLDRVKGLSRADKKLVVDFHKADEDCGVSDATEFLKDGAPGPADVMVMRERSGLIEEALAALSLKERACMEFHYLDSKTHREIAEILGLPQDTVSTVIRRTREKLKNRLIKRGLET